VGSLWPVWGKLDLLALSLIVYFMFGSIFPAPPAVLWLPPSRTYSSLRAQFPNFVFLFFSTANLRGVAVLFFFAPGVKAPFLLCFPPYGRLLVGRYYTRMVLGSDLRALRAESKSFFLSFPETLLFSR